MMLPCRLCCLFLAGGLVVQTAADSFADTVVTHVRRDGVLAIQTSRRAERALLPPPRASQTRPRLRPSQGTQDFLAAINRQRPIAIQAVGNVRTYAATLSLDQATTLKGFTYEQSLQRRWNSKSGPNRYELAGVNHEFADVLEVDRSTGEIRRTLQVYSGGNPRTALHKLIVSDVDADKLVIPRDCFQKIDDVLDHVLSKRDGILSSMRSGQMDAATGLRQIRGQFQKIGVQLNPETLEASFRGRSLGRVDDAGFRKQFSQKLVRDKLSSPAIYETQLKAQLETSRGFDELRQWVGHDAQATKIAMAAYSERRAELMRGGKTEAVASRKARLWVEHNLSNDTIESLKQAEQRASLMGVTQEEITSARASFQGDPVRHTTRLEAQAQQRWRASQMKAQAIVLGFTALGAGLDLAASDRELSEWLKDRGTEWGARAVVANWAVEAASLLERKLIQTGGANAGRTVVQSVGRRLVVGGTAGAIFIAGDALIAVAFRDASFAEVRDMAAEAVLVLTISSGAVMGAEYLLTAAGAGSWAGPVGVAVSVGVVLAYEGAKYAYRQSYELEGDTMVFSARCDVARQKVDRWCEEVLRSRP